MRSVVEVLESLFPGYKSAEMEGAWSSLKLRVRPGESLSGTVVHVEEFGVFVDVGTGFPALLEVINFEQAGKRRMRSPEDYPAKGATVEGRVVGFSEPTHQIALSQRQQD